METRTSEVEISLARINSAFVNFRSFYSLLLEKGISQTKYRETFDEMDRVFRELYATSMSGYDALLFNKRQFEEGRLERDAFERSLTRIERSIISAEFEVGTRILPHLKKTEKELLEQHILREIDQIDLPPEIREEIGQEAEKIRVSIVEAEEESTIDQIEKYVNIGQKIIKLGQKAWKFAKQIAPVVAPLILSIFKSA